MREGFAPRRERATQGLNPVVEKYFATVSKQQVANKHGKGVKLVRKELNRTRFVGQETYFDRVVHYVRTTWQYWDRNEGRDHIFTVRRLPDIAQVCSVGGQWDLKHSDHNKETVTSPHFTSLLSFAHI